MALLREISCVYSFTEVDDDLLGEMMDSPIKVYQLFHPLQYETKEHLVVINLTGKNQVMKYELVATGSANSAIIRPAEVLRTAILLNAPHIILVHNHPSGDPTPSPRDYHFTEQIQSAAKLFGIKVLDHIVIGHDNFDRAMKE